jgi:hypothetical protein
MIRVSVFAVAVFLASPVAHAQSAAEVKSCWHDAIHFCPRKIVQGVVAVQLCLIANKAALSKPCRDVLAAHGT